MLFIKPLTMVFVCAFVCALVCALSVLWAQVVIEVSLPERSFIKNFVVTKH
jgi:hypothetical protein